MILRDRSRGTREAFPLAVLLVAALAAPAAFGQPAEDFRGRIVDAANALPRATADRIHIRVESWTTDEEFAAHLGTLREGGTDALRDALWKIDKGFVRIGTSLGYPLAIARSRPAEDGGRIVRIVLDRPIQMFEAMRGLRSEDYPFGIVELRLDAEGEGTGSLVAAAKAEFSEEGILEVESYGAQPFRLLGMRAEPSGD